MKGKMFGKRTFDILLVDDDPDELLIFESTLNELAIDHRISYKSNGVEALEYMKKLDQLPDVVFLDINMPYMNGIECLKALRKDPRFGNICIVIYSTSCNEEEIEETFVNGANIFMKKTGDMEQLRTNIKKLLSFNLNCAQSYIRRETFMFTVGTYA